MTALPTPKDAPMMSELDETSRTGEWRGTLVAPSLMNAIADAVRKWRDAQEDRDRLRAENERLEQIIQDAAQAMDSDAVGTSALPEDVRGLFAQVTNLEEERSRLRQDLFGGDMALSEAYDRLTEERDQARRERDEARELLDEALDNMTARLFPKKLAGELDGEWLEDWMSHADALAGQEGGGE